MKIFKVLNRTLYENIQRMNSEKNLTLVLLEYQKGQLRLCGQQKQIIIIRSGGLVERIDTIDLGFPLGIISDIADLVAEMQVQLNRGDVVVLYTDGITEAENIDGEHYGLDRLCQIASQNWTKTAKEIRQIVTDDLRQHIGEQTIYDDITLVVFKQK